MPTKFSDSLQYLIDAVSGSVAINSAVLEGGYFPKDNSRSAVYFKGRQSVVFAFQLGKQLKAVKIWPSGAEEKRRKRYSIIERYLGNAGLNYFSGISYLKEAITLRGQLYDVLLMDWVGRQNIKEYIVSNLDKREKIDALAKKILRLHLDLNQARISHGHLHTGNIYVDAQNELRLIDYDSIFIDDRMEEDKMEQSYPDYCHPANSIQTKLNLQADYFSALILYLGTKAVAQDSVLWGRYKAGHQENFLFSAADFLGLRNAPIYNHFRKIQSPEIDKLLEILAMYCDENDPSRLQPFYTYLEKDLPAAIQQTPDAENRASKITKAIVLDTPADEIHAPVSVTIPAMEVPGEKSETQQAEFSAARTIFVDDIPLHTRAGNPLSGPSITENKQQGKHSNGVEDNSPFPALPEDTLAKKNTPRKAGRKPDKSKTVLFAAEKRKKIRFIVVSIFSGLVIFAASYFLGDLADRIKSDSLVFQLNPSAKAPPEDLATKNNSTPTPAVDLKKDAAPGISSATDNGNARAPKEQMQNRDAPAKIPPANPLPVNPVTVQNNKDSIEKITSAVNTQYLKKPAPDITRTTTHIKKQPATAFSIGSVPKQ